jgi:hypothetical protein
MEIQFYLIREDYDWITAWFVTDLQTYDREKAIQWLEKNILCQAQYRNYVTGQVADVKE